MARLLPLLVAAGLIVACGADAPSGPPNVTIVAVAGPTCPVVRPGDPACDARPVAGAVVVIREAAGGSEVVRVTTAADGTAVASLPSGSFVFEPQPVDGLLGTAAPTSAEIEAGVQATIDLEYDTGIR